MLHLQGTPSTQFRKYLMLHASSMDGRHPSPPKNVLYHLYQQEESNISALPWSIWWKLLHFNKTFFWNKPCLFGLALISLWHKKRILLEFYSISINGLSRRRSEVFKQSLQSTPTRVFTLHWSLSISLTDKGNCRASVGYTGCKTEQLPRVSARDLFCTSVTSQLYHQAGGRATDSDANQRQRMGSSSFYQYHREKVRKPV